MSFSSQYDNHDEYLKNMDEGSTHTTYGIIMHDFEGNDYGLGGTTIQS